MKRNLIEIVKNMSDEEIVNILDKERASESKSIPNGIARIMKEAGVERLPSIMLVILVLLHDEARKRRI